MSLEVTSLGVQVHGGMGFIEETGAAQYYRDARILTIYEGTTAIQSNDLVGRKTARDGGQTAHAIVAQARQTAGALMGSAEPTLVVIGERLTAGCAALDRIIAHIADHARSDPRDAYAGSVPYLMAAGIVLAGWQMGRAALIAVAKQAGGDGDPAFLAAKIATARFYADHILTRAPGLAESVVSGAEGTLALAEAQF
jgi:butyryl-CoA dehydrogenase